MDMNECIFCKIAAHEIPAHVVWEDETHMAFLTPFPNTEGFTVVITKHHFDSYVADLPDEISNSILSAAKIVARKIDSAFDDVGRTGLIFEGFGVNHIHIKLFPMHGTKNDEWKQHKSNVKKYFDFYEGYISSHDHDRVGDTLLAATAAKIRAG